MDILAYIDRIEDLYGNVLPRRKPPRPVADQYQDYKQVQGMFEPRTQMYIEKEMGFDDGGQVIGKPGGLVEPGVTHYAKWPTRKGKIRTEEYALLPKDFTGLFSVICLRSIFTS